MSYPGFIFTPMLTYSQAYYESLNKLQKLYDEQEASAIAHQLTHHITGLDKIQRLLDKDCFLTEAQQKQFDSALNDLLKGWPLQYVLGYAWFMGRKYRVNENVLIPRPETEEIVQWIINDWKATKSEISILDVGTGSGCIAISLKLAIPLAKITACDMSKTALSVAKENTETLMAEIDFIQTDFLDENKWNELKKFDIIVSNPPYITTGEKETLHTNVRDFEPSMALFVTNNDPLQFYKAIAKFGMSHLAHSGRIYCELHRDHAQTCKKMFEDTGYKNVEIRQDIHGNWRMLKASPGYSHVAEAF